METIYFTETMWQFRHVLAIATPFGRKCSEMSRKLIWGRGHQGTMSDRARAVAYYQQHIDTIRREVPPEKLLVFKATDGWNLLCEFLSVPVPLTPFPNVNSREQFQQIKRRMAMGAYVMLGVGAATLGGLAYWIGG